MIAMTANTDIVRACFEAYRTRDRAAIERLLGDDLTFTSPYDDAIDRATYFERCWPNADRITGHVIDKTAEIGDEVYVTYLCRTKEGKEFRNTELFRLRDGQVRRIEVFFGACWRDGKFVPQHHA